MDRFVVTLRVMSSASGPNTHHWYEYPVGRSGEFVYAYLRTLAPFGVGVVVAFALVIAVGFFFQEGPTTIYYDVGDERIFLSETMDYLGRVMLIPLAALGFLAAAGVCLCLGLRDRRVSRTLAEAAAAGAPRRAVPTPT